MKHGFSILIILFVLVLVLGAVGYGANMYYVNAAMTITPTPYGTVVPASSPVSESTDTKTIESELLETNIGTVESDITDLKTSADGL